MSHYICNKCKGVSDTPSVCTTEGCPKKGDSLKKCDCSDNMHKGVLKEGILNRIFS